MILRIRDTTELAFPPPFFSLEVLAPFNRQSFAPSRVPRSARAALISPSSPQILARVMGSIDPHSQDTFSFLNRVKVSSNSKYVAPFIGLCWVRKVRYLV